MVMIIHDVSTRRQAAIIPLRFSKLSVIEIEAAHVVHSNRPRRSGALSYLQYKKYRRVIDDLFARICDEYGYIHEKNGIRLLDFSLTEPHKWNI